MLGSRLFKGRTDQSENIERFRVNQAAGQTVKVKQVRQLNQKSPT